MLISFQMYQKSIEAFQNTLQTAASQNDPQRKQIALFVRPGSCDRSVYRRNFLF